MSTTTDSAPVIEVHPVLAKAFRSFDDAAVVWCVLRGEHDLSRPRGDVDLLVAEGDLDRVGQLVAECGFVPFPARGYRPHNAWLSYDEATDCWLKLDVVTELAFGAHFGLSTGQGGACLARRLDAAQIPRLCDEDAFWSLLLHCLLDKGAIPAPEAVRLRELAPVGSHGPLARFVEPLLPAGWTAEAVVERAGAADWRALRALGPDLARGWREARRLEVTLCTARNRARRRAGKLVGLRRLRGASIALLAPDGAGKSTLSAGIADSFYFPVRLIYMGLYQRARGAPGGPRGLAGLGLARRLLRVWWRWLQAQGHVSRGRLVVFDRYPYDAALPPRRPLGRSGRARRWMLARACPCPDQVVVLDAPGAVLHARKGEQDPASLEHERQAYRRLAARLPNAAIVDVDRDADQVRRQVTVLAWAVYRRRWSSGRRAHPDLRLGRAVGGALLLVMTGFGYLEGSGRAGPSRCPCGMGTDGSGIRGQG